MVLRAYGDLSVGIGAGDDNGGEEPSRSKCSSAVGDKAMGCSMSGQAQAGALSAQRQSHDAQTPLANEAGRVE
jgi:hypothetical protein